MTVDQADPRQLLVTSARMLHQGGCDSNVGGQISMRGPEAGSFWAVGFVPFDLVAPEHVALLDADLAVVDGTFPMAPAMRSHAAVYRNRADVGAVIHVHARSTAAFSALQVPLGMYEIGSVLFAGEQANYADDGRRPHSAVADALGSGRVVIMANHGALFASEDLPHAVVDAITFERVAATHLRVATCGGRQIIRDEVAAGRAAFRPGYYEMMWRWGLERVRRVDSLAPTLPS